MNDKNDQMNDKTAQCNSFVGQKNFGLLISNFNIQKPLVFKTLPFQFVSDTTQEKSCL